VLLDALVELAGESADGRLVANVGRAQAPQVLARLEEDDGLAQAGGARSR
jgi:hypothetical protein